ncbi:MAG: hypothetical protein AB7O79_14655, partial [Xanthobacteraceae bacterium]
SAKRGVAGDCRERDYQAYAKINADLGIVPQDEQPRVLVMGTKPPYYIKTATNPYQDYLVAPAMPGKACATAWPSDRAGGASGVGVIGAGFWKTLTAPYLRA